MLVRLLVLVIMSIKLFAMHSIELNINDLDLETGVKLDIGQFTNNVEPDTTFIGISYINANEEYSNDENKNSISELGGYFNFNFLVKQEIRNSDFSLGLGMKIVLASIKNPNLDLFRAIPLGIEGEYILPFDKVIPILLNTKVYYAPESLTFSDARSYLEYRVEVNMEVIQRGTLYFGYRSINTNYTISDIEYDYVYNESGYFGFKFNF